MPDVTPSPEPPVNWNEVVSPIRHTIVADGVNETVLFWISTEFDVLELNGVCTLEFFTRRYCAFADRLVITDCKPDRGAQAHEKVTVGHSR